jgi:transcriptional regulator with XRE-family HTH domain
MDFGKYIKSQRLKSGLTIRDVVARTGDVLDKTTISRIERNERNVSLKAAFFFSEIYGIDMKTIAKKFMGDEAKIHKVKVDKKKRLRGRPPKR